MVFHAFLNWLRDMFNHTGVQSPGNSTRQSEDLEVGQGLVEYALIIILVGVVVLAMLFILGPAISNLYQNIIAQF